MKKIWLISFAIFYILCACKDPFSPVPLIPREDGGDARSALNITVTQGGKRSIELNWDAVSGAVRYHIARANTPLEPFVQCGETTDNGFKFEVGPGTTVYYRVKAIFAGGKESEWSSYVMGSSLAQPVITDITEITESSATITWYMNNVSDATYKAGLRYIAYCFNQTTGAEVAQIALDGSLLAENKAQFTGLSAETKYSYQVEAFLISDQSNSEKSDIEDRETAIRSKPGAPVNLKAALGTAKNEIELSFELPEPVKIKHGEFYEQHGLFFVISKRIYGDTQYLIVNSHLGIADYDVGKTVTWVDTGVRRDFKYEYQVQAYVDGVDNVRSSDESKASAVGWALAEGELSIGTPVYTKNEDESFYVSVKLPLDFAFDTRGVAYRYAVVETAEPLEDSYAYDPDIKFERKSSFLSYEQMVSFVSTMNLAQKSSAGSPGRGLYSYQAEIFLPDGTEPVDVIWAIGDIQISEDVQPLVLEEFHVQDGYTDKFIFKWPASPDLDYLLFKSTDKVHWEQIREYKGAHITIDQGGYSVAELGVAELGGNATVVTVYFAMQPVRWYNDIEKKGQRFYHSESSKTLGIPQVSLDGNSSSYSTVTAVWTEAQKADTYRIKYWYTENGVNTAAIAGTVKASELSLDAAGNFRYPFRLFADNVVDVSKAGKEIQITVDALNEGLRATVGGGEIVTTSREEVKTCLVGPALLELSASKATSASSITVSWNRISGADGYYVFRRQFNMNNTAEEGTEAIVYYVPSTQSGSVDVTGKDLLLDTTGAKVDALTVKALVSFTGMAYQLTDNFLSDIEYDGSYGRHTPTYRNQQNDLVQGYPYRYYVVPVVNRGGAPEPLANIVFAYGQDGSNKNTNIASCTIRENNSDVRYPGAASIEQEGFAIGFGQNVVATKGTYSSSGNVNNGIKITWEPPQLLSTVSGFSPRYALYRRATGGAWEAVTSLEAREYNDTPQIKGVAYEYAVGIANGNTPGGSDPRNSGRFIELCYTLRDDKLRPNMLGFMLDMVKMESVSRNEIKVGNDFAENVKWYSAGIKNSANSGDLNWGIDGYMVFVMNRNIDGNWHEIFDMSNIPNQTDQSVLVTNNTGLLKVLRDYKHYFKVRSYVTIKDDEKIYCPDPPFDYEALYAADKSKLGQDAYRADQHKLETEYVKWGARQVTPTEFVKIATLAMTWGIHKETTGTAWTTRYGWIRWTDTNGNNGSAGRIGVETSFGVGRWYFNIQNYRPDMDTNANRGNWDQSVTFVTIDTGATDSRKTIYADSGGSGSYPDWYGSYDNYGSEFCDIKGPADTPNLYTGALRFVTLRWTSGYTEVKYPANAASVQVTNAQTSTPLPFQNHKGNPNYRYNLDAWY
jgi:hypothetical protein